MTPLAGGSTQRGRITMTVYEMRTYTLHVGKMAEAAAIPATHLVAFLFILLQHSLSGSCLHEGQIGSELCLRWGRYDVKK